jgi:hypothetical protein
MSDSVVFVLVFIGLLIIRIGIASAFFLLVLPEADRCPICDCPTLRIQSAAWNVILPWIRTSWCTDCGWQGLQRPGKLSARTTKSPEKKTVPAP